MSRITRRVSALELRFASLMGNERRDEHGRTPAEAILEARRRRRAKEGLPPEENRPPTPFRAGRRPQVPSREGSPTEKLRESLRAHGFGQRETESLAGTFARALGITTQQLKARLWEAAYA